MDRCVRQVKSRSKLIHSLLAGAVGILPVAPAFGQTWTGSTDDNWFTAANWSGDVVPNSSSAAAVIDNGTNNPVILNASATVSTLSLGLGDSLDQTGGVFVVDGGSISNAGDLELGSQLQVAGGDLTLSGSGTFTLSGGGQIGGDGYGRTLFNQSTIQGAGVIGSNAGALYQAGLSLNNSGTIDANSSGNTLTLQQGGGTFVNSDLMEATSGGVLNLATSAALNNTGGTISAAGAGSTVMINTDVQGGTLATTGGGVIETGGNGAYLDGVTNGAITLTDGSTYTAGTSGLTQALGTLDLGTGSGATLALSGQLRVTNGDLTFAGPGTVTMNGGQIGGDGYGRTLNNEVTIQGSGVIGSNSGQLYQAGLSLNNTGTIDANSAGNTLTLQQGGGTFINTDLLEATNGGTLNLAVATALNDAGGNITASGLNSVVLVNMDVQGGTLNTSAGGVIETGGSGAYLDGATNGAITISNGSTYTTTTTSGLTQAVGVLDLGTSGAGATLALTEQLQLKNGDLTLAGPGLVTMSGNAQIGGDGYGRTLYNEATIQGSGVIGSNSGALYQAGLSLNNSGVIDADLSGQTLTLQQNGGIFINSNLLEATAGGTLNLIAGAPVDNAGGNITASGASSTVLVNMDVQGGTLNTSAGGVIETGGSGAYLDGVTNGAITISNGSTYTTTTASGLTQAVGVLDLGTSGAGATLALTEQLRLTNGDLTLAGPGLVTMSGSAQIGGDGYGRTLNNEVTIQGAGVIGSNSGALYQAGLSLNNSGVIDANSSGATLTLQQGGGTFINTSLLEATGGGILNLAAGAPLTNAGGDITAAGSGSLVTVNMQVQGGTLNTSGGGMIETGNSGAFLNGATANGAIMISDGSTYTAGSNALTQAVGTLDIGTGATLALTGQLQLNSGDLTLAGLGTVAMSGTAQIGGDAYGRTLNNGVTIEGSGDIGSNTGALYQNITVVNQAAGTLLANISGQTLTISGTGGLTNNGVMQADAGATLHATQGFTNYGGGTLSGGTYNMYSGVIQIDALGATGGEITTNNANIVLSGPTAVLTDAAGLNALSNLSTNASGASLTVENGNAFVTAATSPFTNNGSVQVGTGSTFDTLSDYDQSGASSSTKVDGTLTPGSGAFALASGVLSGSGVVAADVTNTGGVVNPGDTIGTLRTLGYDQGSAGTLEIEIASTSSYDVLDVTGAVTLDGLLDPVLRGGFTPTLGESFTFLDYASRTGEFSGIENDVFDGGRYMWEVTYNPTDAILTVEAGPGGGVSAAPEPSTWALLLMGVGGVGLAMRRAKRRTQARLKAAFSA